VATFEEQLTALEQVVEKLERGDLPLDESVRLFEEGMTLSNACKKELEEAEGRIQVLVERGSRMVVKDLEVEEDADEDEE